MIKRYYGRYAGSDGNPELLVGLCRPDDGVRYSEGEA